MGYLGTQISNTNKSLWKTCSISVILLQSPQREQELTYEFIFSIQCSSTTCYRVGERGMKSPISNFITNTENKSKFKTQDFVGE